MTNNVDLPNTEICRGGWMEDGHVEPTGWHVTLVTRRREVGFRFSQGGDERGTNFEVRVGARDFWKIIAAMSAAMDTKRWKSR